MSILYPVFVLVALTAITLFRLAFARVRAIREGRASIGYFTTYQDGREPDDTRVLARHYDNLFQAPLLFYVAALVILITHRETPLTLGLRRAARGALGDPYHPQRRALALPRLRPELDRAGGAVGGPGLRHALLSPVATGGRAADRARPGAILRRCPRKSSTSW